MFYQTRHGQTEFNASVWYYQGSTLIAVDAMTDALSYGVAKKLLEPRRTASKAAIADPGTEIKDLLSA